MPRLDHLGSARGHLRRPVQAGDVPGRQAAERATAYYRIGSTAPRRSGHRRGTRHYSAADQRRNSAQPRPADTGRPDAPGRAGGRGGRGGGRAGDVRVRHPAFGVDGRRPVRLGAAARGVGDRPATDGLAGRSDHRRVGHADQPDRPDPHQHPRRAAGHARARGGLRNSDHSARDRSALPHGRDDHGPVLAGGRQVPGQAGGGGRVPRPVGGPDLRHDRREAGQPALAAPALSHGRQRARASISR